MTVAAMLVLATGCGTGILPGDPMLESGSRQWIIPVQNESAREAVLLIAEDAPFMGDAVGRVEPSTVPPNTTQDVVFTVPPGDGWAIFVNPGPDRGSLIGALDVPPHAEGRLPVTIIIAPNGDPGAAISADAGPGWFGN
jgi:hypothetical protein